jgi:hypothetical protein
MSIHSLARSCLIRASGATASQPVSSNAGRHRGIGARAGLTAARIAGAAGGRQFLARRAAGKENNEREGADTQSR